MDTRTLRVWNALAIANGETKYSDVVPRTSESQGHYSFGLGATETSATSTVKVRLMFNNLSESEYARACGFVTGETAAARAAKELANTVGWVIHNAVAEITLTSSAENDIAVVSKPWKRCRLRAVSSGGAATLISDCAAG